jgi:predicted CoA-substrate-specific enzyme activase
MGSRFIGIDVGAETIKVVELSGEGSQLAWTRRHVAEHQKEPGAALRRILADWGWPSLDGAAVSGRLSRQVNLPRVPTKQAQAIGFKHLFGSGAGTVVSIGSAGFSVLELRAGGAEVFRENSRCSQGTGNFLRQLVERFDMTIEQASAVCEAIADPAPLSGRCPVILKTDMTHLANKGESRARILAGLFDAVCENVQVLLKPRLSPPKVVLVGGVARSKRIQEHFRRFLSRHEMELAPLAGDDFLFLEALGCAAVAAQEAKPVPALDVLLAPLEKTELEPVPALKASLPKVKRMPRLAIAGIDGPRDVILGFDIGSTGSKAIALDIGTLEVVWEGYLRTNGNPVVAAQQLMKQFVDSPARICRVRAAGATGSGREIVGSLMASCYGAEGVFVMNEIAAHARGAAHFEPRVDTIFEIGGQDAKYIRLAGGRVIDAAMNEACSAGTGSFIEEQGKKFQGIQDVAHLGKEALEAPSGISLGQHCSVFMAEIIDEAVAAGADQRSIVAGIYDSIIQNYLNRVKGSRTVGQVIFCQGMPFAADALAAAVVRQTGSEVVIPPNPGTVGALGIALLTLDQLRAPTSLSPLAPERFLDASVEKKDTFVCNSTVGCGGAGNKCRIDRITTRVGGERMRFTWGGGCSLYDKGTRKQKLPDRAPDPFRERDELHAALVAELSKKTGAKTVAITDEFTLKGLFPFFATFLKELGFDLAIQTGADHGALKRGIEEANVPFCAPMQQYHGIVSKMAEGQPDFLFMPMLREVTRAKDEEHSVVCPIVQASPDMLRWDLGKGLRAKVVATLVDAGPGNLASAQFQASCERIARDFGVEGDRWRPAYHRALDVQNRFDDDCLALGRKALEFCEERGITPVVVLGRSYTIYNAVLNSNVPAILREQGAIAIPVDCYPIADDVPIFKGMFWSYGQRNLRAAHQVRRKKGAYALYCSNYSCGPDSFTLHFFSYIMDGKPFAIIETDGHSGDAGTKTRVEAFLHCVREDLKAQSDKEASQLLRLDEDNEGLDEVKRNEEVILIPRMGPGAETLAAAFRGIGLRAEALAMPDRDTLRLGRRHTSGKECVPMTITAGSVLDRVMKEKDPLKRFSFFMPTAYGPCRFGAYNLLHKIILERLGYSDRVRVFSPNFSSYYAAVPDGFAALIMTGFMGSDLLQEALYDVRPVEKKKGAAQAIVQRYERELNELIEEAGRGDLSGPGVLLQVATGNLFGLTDLLDRAGRDLAEIKGEEEKPTVLVVGEIYVRCDAFANDYIVEKLEERGMKVRFAPFNEWLEYSDHINYLNGERSGLASHLSSFVRGVIQSLTYSVLAEHLGWPRRTTVRESLAAAEPYVRGEFQGETVLTVGGPVHEWREGIIDGVVSVGPLECMPNKISESQFFHVAENEGMLSLTLSLNGDPVAPEAIDNFAFEVQQRFKRGLRPAHPRHEPPAPFVAAAKRAKRMAEMAFLSAPQGMKLLRNLPFFPARKSNGDSPGGFLGRMGRGKRERAAEEV